MHKCTAVGVDVVHELFVCITYKNTSTGTCISAGKAF